MVGWFSLTGPDNDSHMCGSADRLHPEVRGVPICNVCGYKTDPFFVDPEFRLKHSTYDFSYTYDGYAIVSDRFRAVVEDRGLSGADYVTLPRAPGFYVLVPNSMVEFDAARRKTRFESWCPACQHYGSIAGATPAFLKELPQSDFSRTDVEFGSGNERHYMVVVSERTKEALEDADISGPEFRAVAA